MTGLKEKELTKVLDAINNQYGYDFSEYALPFLQRRMERVMKKNNIATIEKLQSQIIRDKWFFFREVIEEITIRVTELFRDPPFFLSLHANVIPRLVTYPTIRVWVAGCSTGEEAYSTAILLDAYGLYDRARIYCTDINKAALQKAKKGVYPAKILDNRDIPWIANLDKDLSSYYSRSDDMITFHDSIKQNMVFSFHNLVSDQSFNEFQLILCRNVLIYFNEQLQNKVLKLLYESLCSYCFLALGSKETVMFSEWENHFQTVDANNKIYKKLSHG